MQVTPSPAQGFISEPWLQPPLPRKLAACRLTTLPANLSTLVPNLRVLNLNYNFVEDDDSAAACVGRTGEAEEGHDRWGEGEGDQGAC